LTDLLSGVLQGFAVSFEPVHLFVCLVGVTVGTLIGVLPGVGPVAGMSLLLPLTIKLDPTAAIIMMAGIYYGAMYGGSTTAILLNIPGEAASVATCLDGYAMARQGRAGPALGIAAFGSFIAGTLGVVGITLLAPPLATLALKFGPPEMVAVLILGFTMMTNLAEGSRLKAAAMALTGFLLGTVGLDPVDALPRFDFGSLTLMEGFGFAPLVIGLFGISEVLWNLDRAEPQPVFRARISGLLPSRQDWKDSALPIARGGMLGFILGILPGAGAIIPPFVAYALEKRLARDPSRFGKGAIEGVAAPESANNAATAGAMIPLLTLGIPPSAAVAILTAAFLTHGVQPGPLLVTQHPDIFWGVVTSMYTGNVILLILNLPLIGLWVRLLAVPYRMLFPVILLLCVIGVYSVNGNPWEIVVMTAFGVLGYLMRKFGYEAAPLILTFILGRIFEEAVRQSLVLSRGSFAIFASHPISLAALVLAALVVMAPLAWAAARRRRTRDGL
jgi:putative tricarboxylic transport membrane protein